ncbi:hypothetical protein KKG63_03695 [Patescibacteria group bacterium]|nr:hypothetical protein [Patescibacteria group bacterium]
MKKTFRALILAALFVTLFGYAVAAQSPAKVYVGTFLFGERPCASDEQCQPFGGWAPVTMCPEAIKWIAKDVLVVENCKCVFNHCEADFYNYRTCRDAGFWPPPQ